MIMHQVNFLSQKIKPVEVTQVNNLHVTIGNVMQKRYGSRTSVYENEHEAVKSLDNYCKHKIAESEKMLSEWKERYQTFKENYL